MKNVWLLVLACICMTACRNRQQSAEVTNYDLPQIKDSGELVVLTLNSSTSYFDYRGEPMGFQYELADQFARSLNVKLKIKVAQNARDLVHKLLQGEGDLIAYNLPVTKEFKDRQIHRRSNRRPPFLHGMIRPMPGCYCIYGECSDADWGSHSKCCRYFSNKQHSRPYR